MTRDEPESAAATLPASSAARGGGPEAVELAPGASLGPYVLEEKLGAGGMGTVYRARDSRLGRTVAVKVIAGLDGPARRRFEREARLLASLSHPNIVAIHDVGGLDAGTDGECSKGHDETDMSRSSLPYIVLELLAGETLRARLRRGPVGARELVAIALAIARALAAAHARAVVHRDLKPENVFLCREGPLKVLDFGIAKDIGEGDAATVTASGSLIGTPNYMSPEQLRGEDVDPRSDLFSLGVLLHEALAGRPPFQREALVETVVAILRDAPPPLAPRTVLERELAAIVDACLCKDRAGRAASAAALVTRLEALAASSDAPLAPARVVVERTMPDTLYARSGEVHIAYQVVGEGPLDVLLVPGFASNVERWWDEPEGRRFVSRLAAHARLILFDKRGTGLSDRVPDDSLPVLEQRIDDVRAVMSAADSRRPVLFGISEGGPMCLLFAARHPERTRGLVLYGTTARLGGSPRADAQLRRILADVERSWGSGTSIPVFSPGPDAEPRLRRWGARWERTGASPGAAKKLLEMLMTVDVTPVLREVTTRALVLHRRGDPIISIESARMLARKLAGAQLVEFEGDEHAPFLGDNEGMLARIGEFLDELAGG